VNEHSELYNIARQITFDAGFDSWTDPRTGETHRAPKKKGGTHMTGKGEAVRDALDALFSDTSVEKQVTLDDLEEIQGDLETKIKALEADIKNEKRR
jgi:hypothetical protein